MIIAAPIQSRTQPWVRLAVVWLAGTLAQAQSPDAKHPPAYEQQAESTISRFMAANKIPGLAVAIVDNQEFVWAGGFGVADLENPVPATAHTLFRLGSLSKPLTAIGAMELWESGKLDLNAPVQNYCPAIPDKGAEITTRELLGHLSGVRHYHSESIEDPEVSNIAHFDDPIQGGLRFFKNDPLLSKPGTQFHYSTQGYTVVGCAIEGASKQKYVDYMRDNVFLPIGMTQTVVDDRYAIIPGRTQFYQKDKAGKVVNAEFLDSSYKIPGGGWLSNAEDMARFEVALLANRLVKQSTLDLMWTPSKPSISSKGGYGLGWGSFSEKGILYVGHSGGQQGTSTNLLIAPEKKSAVVVLINMENVSADRLSKQLLQIVLQNGIPSLQQ
jgi:serine beta-lactamase-like protein LACTB